MSAAFFRARPAPTEGLRAQRKARLRRISNGTARLRALLLGSVVRASRVAGRRVQHLWAVDQLRWAAPVRARHRPHPAEAVRHPAERPAELRAGHPDGLHIDERHRADSGRKVAVRLGSSPAPTVWRHSRLRPTDRSAPSAPSRRLAPWQGTSRSRPAAVSFTSPKATATRSRHTRSQPAEPLPRSTGRRRAGRSADSRHHPRRPPSLRAARRGPGGHDQAVLDRFRRDCLTDGVVRGRGRFDGTSLPITPDQPPVAAFSVSTQPGKQVFNASASTDRRSIARYDWDFADDKKRSSSSPVATTPSRRRQVCRGTLTVVDDAGCSTTFVATARSPIATVRRGPA